MALTREQFFTAVLRGLGVPVTRNNLLKLGAVAVAEGSGGTYNPFNYILGPGTNFNSAGVKNYADAQTGIAQTIRLLSQKNTSAMRANLAADGTYQDFIGATTRFYTWGKFPNITTANAEKGLSSTIKGSGPGDIGVALAQSGGGLPSSYDPADPLGWKQIAASMAAGSASQQQATAQPERSNVVPQQERDLFNAYLKTLPEADQARIISELKQPRSLSEVAQYMASAPPEVNRYINFLSTMDNAGQYSERSLLSAPDPAANKQMTDLLGTFGVSYPNAPNATPALLAFLNGIGLNLSTAEDVKRRAVERIGASTSDALSDIDRTAGRTKQNVTADLVRRGVLSSGEANTRYARQEEDVGAQRADVQRASTTAVEQTEDAYSQTKQLARQQALDRIIGAEQDQATQRAQSAAQVDVTQAEQQAQDDAFTRQQAAQNAAIKAQEDAIAKYAAQGVVV